ncbi:hypothetical protein BJ994_002929 [Arthrobacter pigmenti]|uniref:DUF222 domain-containing protein n=1 Tax=Arthrobacter pigmenti TaxID=271432 RepID=A0A846RKW2_9MICC|nr:HNH endonuclease signature motif containing protein [Arthrobacter pigmenti]NJC23853.1 hypothetical protein [Arthrobacter pigmenti]
MNNGSGMTLEDAYAEASLRWSEVPLAYVLDPEGTEEPDALSREPAQASAENASVFGLVGRLHDVAPSDQPESLSDTLERLRAADRLESWAAARKAALIARVFHSVRGHELRTGDADQRFVFTVAAQEIAPLLRVPGRTAHRMLGEALRLSEILPGTWQELDQGKISAVQAQVIVEESGSIPDEAVTTFEASVLQTAGAMTRPKLTRACRRLREELHPESIAERRSRAVKDRTVTIAHEQDGMAWLGAYLPAEQALGIFNRVDSAARSLQGSEEPRTLSQLRADVFTDVLTHTCTGDPKNGTGFRGIGANVFVTVPLMTLLGKKRADWQETRAGHISDDVPLNDAQSYDNCSTSGGSTGDRSEGASAEARPKDIVFGGTKVDGGTGPDGAPDLVGCVNGLLDGYGPISPETARNLAAHAPSFTRILVHPETGAVLSVGRDRYRPPKHLQDWVRINNPTCIHPGCNRSSWSSELDHTTPWAHGGKTELGNLLPRCKLHHMLKTEGIWSARQDNQGVPDVTSFGGETYTAVPEPPPPF